MSRIKLVYLKLTTWDGSPVKVRVLHGWRPVIVNPSQVYEVCTAAKGWLEVVASVLKRLKFA